MKEDNRFKNSNFNEVYGELQNVHAVRRGCADKFLAPAALLFLVVFGVIVYVSSNDSLTIPCCIVLPVLLFATASWQIFSTRGDELRIYENGFTYKSGKDLQACLWTEIKECRIRERSEREVGELTDGAFPLGAIEKESGETIDFETDLPGTEEILARFNQGKL